MDPLSIVAGVIAIATAAAQISKAISRLRAFGEVPGRVYALKNEIVDLEVVLRQVGHALQQRSLAPDAEIAQESLNQILSRAKAHLTELANALERVAKSCDSARGNVKVIRNAIWWKEKARFQRYQGDIRAVKETLNLMLGASNSRDLQNIIFELRQVTVLTSEEGSLNSITEEMYDERLPFSSRMEQHYQGLNNRIEALGRLFAQERMQENGSNNLPPPYEEKNGTTNVESLRVLITPRAPCRNWCPCACHETRKRKVTPPGVMENLLGKMFVGYTGLPVLNNPCDFRGCRDKQTPSATVEYWFPWWFVSMNMKLYLKYLPNAGPQFQLTTTRRVPDSSQSIVFAMEGNIEGLQYLFNQGLASPRDVSDSRGYTLMRWALYGGMHQYRTVQFLLSKGAVVDEISYDNVWDFVFRGKCNEKEEYGLRCITQGGEGDWVEEQNFPLVHRIIFGLSSKSLVTELEENPLAVYLTDGQGRTALDWATARIQLEDISHLLSHGADPNSMDTTGRTTVLHAVDSHSIPCLRLILEAGGNPNPKMPKGIYRSSPLTAAGFGGMPEMLKLLLDFGGDPNACNPEGLTALHSVARTQNVDCALTLLEFGANLNALSSNGRTPLTTALIHNNHEVLQLFVDRCYEYMMDTSLKGPQLLPIIAEHADIKTMTILASSKPLKLSYDLSINSLAENREILQQRRDYDENMGEAFDELVSIVQADEGGYGSPDSLLESGFFYSARSSFHSDLADAMAKLNSANVSSSGESMDENSDKFDSAQASPVT
ncbi:hypothetical protein HYFRA_00004561 [Hymenoscyphus fraxineus]|uniref:Azaphilone pigments biosynthesis cluster protein L N-terminal domain-containing protein n=1 Tax=Hymenoscyphus fraxineus TaxID=746836 RepID=A0A9N9KVQ0_9HELO|nr:hypothetical protein HYFRA_00004561 [Hymenoscyphus fraxineus]